MNTRRAPTVWRDFDPIQSHVPYWPTGEVLPGSDTARTVWKVQTLADLPDSTAPLIACVGRTSPSSPMSFTFTLTGPRTFDMTCDGAKDIEGPYRIGIASVVWRRIDERVARIWMAGRYPRSSFPAFMTQRRELIRLIPRRLRAQWLWLALIRCAPLLSRVCGGRSEVGVLLDGLQRGDESGLREHFARYASVPSMSVRESPEPIERLLRAAVAHGLHGVETGDVSSTAYATERLLDALLLPRGSSRERFVRAAMDEDRAWFEDAVCLATSMRSATPMTDRTRRIGMRLETIVAAWNLATD